MPNNQKIKKMTVIPLLFCALLIQGTQAYARGGGGGGGGYHGGGGGYHGGGGGYHGGWGGPHWGYGGWCWALPLAAAAVVIAGATYYYDEGVYYQRMGGGYVVVSEPVGTVVTTIPVGYQPTIINGVSYYTINGATYVSTPNGYQVVPPVVLAPQPTVVQVAPQPSTTITQNAAPAQQVPPNVAAPQAPQNAVIENTTQGASPGNKQDSFTVNIPNSKGTYTPVTLKRSGNGFIGPQGEYYTQFPAIDQLKVMYAK